LYPTMRLMPSTRKNTMNGEYGWSFYQFIIPLAIVGMAAAFITLINGSLMCQSDKLFITTTDDPEQAISPPLMPAKEKEEPEEEEDRQHQNPWVSYPIITNSSIHCESWRSTTKYSPRFFLGGGKAGSTGVWQMLLSGTPFSGFGPNSSDYIGFAQEFPKRAHTRGTGKEMCFGSSGRYNKTVQTWESFFEPSSTVTNMGLDCCPQGTAKSRICNLWNLFPCEIKFIMLVRDPADRALSWFNDKKSSFQRSPHNADAWTLNFATKDANFRLGYILTQALECVDPRAILVLDSEGLKESPQTAQAIMDAVDDHYGIPRMKHVQKIENDAGQKDSDRHMHAQIKPQTKLAIRKSLQTQGQKLVQLLQHPGNILRKSLLV
jgi:hypothetical protein